MLRFGPYLFKVAESADELEQVHRLNYSTFVRELAQYEDDGGERLIDKFHEKNEYLICVKEGRVIGMLSAHGQPPFSVAARMPDPTLLTQPGMRPLEVRLLSVEPDERHSPAMLGMVWFLLHRGLDRGFTHFVISGVVEQQGLYRHLGFEPLGPPLGTGRARFVAMWATLARVKERMGRTIELWAKRLGRGHDEVAIDPSRQGDARP